MKYIIKSLGYRTDFIFNRLDGEVYDKGEYLVAKTHSNPNYFWGNLILFKSKPTKGDFRLWKEIFLNEFQNPRIYHMTFAWDSPEGEQGECSEFLENGFEIEKNIVLIATSVNKPPKLNESIEVRPIDLENYMEECIECLLSCADTENLSKESWKNFYTNSMKQFHQFTNNGYGKWFGAFIEGRLAGSLGVFLDGDVARYQLVSTHQRFQRKGVCSSLVYKSAVHAFHHMGAKTLVMVADGEYHAAKIYESVGFKPEQTQIGMCYWNKEKHES